MSFFLVNDCIRVPDYIFLFLTFPFASYNREKSIFKTNSTFKTQNLAQKIIMFLFLKSIFFSFLGAFQIRKIQNLQ